MKSKIILSAISVLALLAGCSKSLEREKISQYVIMQLTKTVIVCQNFRIGVVKLFGIFFDCLFAY